MTALDILIAVIAGGLIGFSMGTVGGGGALLAVPVLVYGLKQTPLQATTGSLLVVGGTALLGSLVAHAQRRVDWRQGLLFGAAAIAGAALGSLAAQLVPGNVLMILFSALMVYVSSTMIRKLVRTRRSPAADTPAWPLVLAVATVVGFLTGFLGVGGGFMIVPALTLVLGVDMRRAAGTSLVVIAITSAAALATRLLGDPETLQPQWASILVLLGVGAVGLLVGAAVVARANNRQLSVGFAALVTAVAIYSTVQSVAALL